MEDVHSLIRKINLPDKNNNIVNQNVINPNKLNK
jgi:hypothetical protein